MVSVPSVLIAHWRDRVPKYTSDIIMPMDRPEESICLILPRSSWKSARFRWNTGYRFQTYSRLSTTDTNWDSTVPSAAPRTPSGSTTINSKSKPIFSTDAHIRKISGATVSPTARKMPAQALYSIVMTSPSRTIQIYPTACPCRYSGTFISRRSSGRLSSETAVRKTAITPPSSSVPAAVFLS